MKRLLIAALLLPAFVTCRGRYEFIDDADLPAFYSMRSAQLAQQAQQQQQLQVQVQTSASSPVGQYSPYYHYPYYQPSVVQASDAVQVLPTTNYNPYLHYAPPTSFRSAATNPTFIAATPTQPRTLTTYGPYSPYFSGIQQMTARNKKKS